MKLFFTHDRIKLFFILVFIHLSVSLSAQSTSNKGTDFWVSYMAHIDGTGSSMDLFITSDVNTSGTVSIPLRGWSTLFTVTANSITDISIPPLIAYDSCSDCIENKGIEVTSMLPIVVYSEIYNSERSEATLALPVPTLGKEYYAIAFDQKAGGYSEFVVVATEDSTQVEITPTSSTLNGHSAYVPFTVTLNKGQVYQVQSTSDLTGSHIITYSSGNSACKRVAVFSGSSWAAVGCGNNGTADNLLEQLYPVNAWGNNFVTAPFKTRIGGDNFRIFAASDNTTVTINGRTPFPLPKNQFTDFQLDSANYITASKPIMLAQYSLTQACDNVTGDPAMVIILPVNQTLDSITVYSSAKPDMTEEFINVIMKTSDTSAFRLDGSHASFSVVPYNNLYSYSQNTVDSGNHTLAADSGFDAIAYGFGDVDAYAYDAGANVQDLNQDITVNSGGVNNPRTVCNGGLINFSATLAYTPVSTIWYFGDGDTSSSLSTSHTYNIPGTFTISLVTVSGDTSCDTKDSSIYVLNIIPVNVGIISSPTDSICEGVNVALSTTGNSGSIQWQSSLTPGNFTNIGGATDTAYSSQVSQTTYFRIYVVNGVCTDTSAVFKITVVPPPVANYTFSLSGDTVTFNSGGSTNVISYFWNFGDGETSTEENPSHIYDTTGTYNICLTEYNHTNCSFTFCQNIAIFPNGINNLNVDDEFQVYPNPFGNSIFINGEEGNQEIRNVTVYDLLGRVVFNQDYDGQKMIEVPLSDLPAGMYYLKLKTGNTNYIQPIIKQ